MRRGTKWFGVELKKCFEISIEEVDGCLQGKFMERGGDVVIISISINNFSTPQNHGDVVRKKDWQLRIQTVNCQRKTSTNPESEKF